MKHIYAIALLLAGITLTASAQEDSGTLPVLAQNPDALSASMGQTGGSTLSGGHYIYSAPGAVFDRSERFSLSYTGIIGTGHDSRTSGRRLSILQKGESKTDSPLHPGTWH